jgi:hypothetical protein
MWIKTKIGLAFLHRNPSYPVYYIKLKFIFGNCGTPNLVGNIHPKT